MRPPVPGHAARTAALRLGDRLEQANMRRAHMARRHVDPRTPGGVAWLMELARLDAYRRRVRARLAVVLEECAALDGVI